jgi:hypothetical protein
MEQQHPVQQQQALASAAAAATEAATPAAATPLICNSKLHVHLNNIHEAEQLAAWLQAATLQAASGIAGTQLDHINSAAISSSSGPDLPTTAEKLQHLRSFALQGPSPLHWPGDRQHAAAAAAAAMPSRLQQACSSALCCMPHLQHLELRQLAFAGDIFQQVLGSYISYSRSTRLNCQQQPSTAAAAAMSNTSLQPLQQLTSLSLQDCFLGATDLPLLLQQLPNLQQLNLSGLVLGPAVWQQYSGQYNGQCSGAQYNAQHSGWQDNGQQYSCGQYNGQFSRQDNRQYSGQVLLRACEAAAELARLTSLDLSGLDMCDAELQVRLAEYTNKDVVIQQRCGCKHVYAANKTCHAQTNVMLGCRCVLWVIPSFNYPFYLLFVATALHLQLCSHAKLVGVVVHPQYNSMSKDSTACDSLPPVGCCDLVDNLNAEQLESEFNPPKPLLHSCFGCCCCCCCYCRHWHWSYLSCSS